MDSQALEILYKYNVAVCQREGVGIKDCEARIENVIKTIQGKTQEVCGEDKSCQSRWFRFHIHTEEIQKLKDRLLQIYT